MNVVFIRHAESQANAGEVCNDFALIAITEKGQQQAFALADGWLQPPNLLVHSPYLRTRQTAAPTILRYSNVPVEIWPVHEFTNLAPSRWNGTSPQDRAPHVARFWQVCDPAFCDGDDAESFDALLARARETLLRLQDLPENHTVFVFSHGFFMNAIRSLLECPDLSSSERMRRFIADFNHRPIGNINRMALNWQHGRWQFTD